MGRQAMKAAVLWSLLAVALVFGAVAPSSASAGCSLDLGYAAVKANVSCHVTNVVLRKATPHVERGTKKFRVYARGYWRCETAPLAEYDGLLCTRRKGIITLVG